jgi:hypothetical protein
MTDESNFQAYRSASTLSRIVIGLFAVQLGCYAIYAILSVVQIAAPDLYLDGDRAITLPYMVIGLLSLVESLARLGTIVMFLVWLYRVYTNFPALRVQHLDFTPGWAVGWWFIPFANLVKPYQAVSEAWRESDPEYDEQFGYLSSRGGSSWQFPLWWGTFILGNITSRIAEMTFQDPTAAELFPYFLIVTVLFSGVSALLAIWIVRDTTARQDLRASRVEQVWKVDQPPPPPTFDLNE